MRHEEIEIVRHGSLSRRNPSPILHHRREHQRVELDDLPWLGRLADRCQFIARWDDSHSSVGPGPRPRSAPPPRTPRGRADGACGSAAIPSSAAAMSSPRRPHVLIWRHGRHISQSSPSPFPAHPSTMITASASLGIGSPVSTHTAWSPTDSFRGLVSDAPTVSAARTATPSIAAAS